MKDEKCMCLVVSYVRFDFWSPNMTRYLTYGLSAYELICEDSIQKIRSRDYIQEAPFIFYIKYKKLVTKYVPKSLTYRRPRFH